MHTNIKRALALSALAPLAFTGITSSAGAVNVRTVNASVEKDGNSVIAACNYAQNTCYRAHTSS